MTGAREGQLLLLRDAAAGVALFGGYLDLPAGQYRAIVWLDPETPPQGAGRIEVCADVGMSPIGHADFDAAALSRVAPFIDLNFGFPAPRGNVEIRLHGMAGLTMAVRCVEIIDFDWNAADSAPDEAPLPNRIARADGRRPLHILYSSCHEILEYDELRLLTDRGHRVFSVYGGAYSDPASQGRFRRPLPQFFQQDDWNRFHREGLSEQFLRNFDAMILMSRPENVPDLLAVRSDLPLVYRSIGQSTPQSEATLAPYAGRVQVVRYSQREWDLPGLMKSDAVIYFAKKLSDFSQPWEGGDRIVTFHNSYPSRDFCSIPTVDMYRQISAIWPCDLYGVENEALQSARGVAAPERQVELYRHAAIYLYIYTAGPSYSLSFMEAMAAGVPILAPSTGLVQRTVSPEYAYLSFFLPERYEIPALLGDDPRMLYDSVDDAHDKIAWLMANPSYCREVSERQRARFAEVFDAEKIGAQWDELLYGMVTGT